MTSNQLAAQQNEIKAAQQKEEARANQAREAETARANRASENLTRRGQNTKLVGDLGGAAVKSASGLIKTIAGMNDPSWYNKDPQLVKDVASMAFGVPLGANEPNFTELKQLTAANETTFKKESVVAGIMALKYTSCIPSVRLMRTIGDKYYAFIRHANSGSRNYEANDLMMYLNAATEAYAQLTRASRIYSEALTYKRENWYYALGYLKAEGFSTSVARDLLKRLPEFRSRLNVLIRRVNSFHIPNTFPLFARKVWMNTHIFKDHAVKRSSNYIFVPDHILLYTETSTHLRLDATAINYTSVDNFLLQLESMVDRIYRSEDLGIMSGDILKAYKDTGLYELSEVPEDYHIEEEYIPEVLSQINSATVVGPVVLNYAGIFTQTTSGISDIVQGDYNDTSSTNGLRVNIFGSQIAALGVDNSNFGQVWLPDTGANADICVIEHNATVVNMYKDEVTPDDVMVATRLQANTHVFKSSVGSINNPICAVSVKGDAIINTINMIKIVKDVNSNNFELISSFDLYDGMTLPYTSQSAGVIDSQNEALEPVVLYLPTFDWAPRIRILDRNYAKLTVQGQTTAHFTETPYVIFDNFDFANYMILQGANLARLHDVAFMSMYDV